MDGVFFLCEEMGEFQMSEVVAEGAAILEELCVMLNVRFGGRKVRGAATEFVGESRPAPYA